MAFTAESDLGTLGEQVLEANRLFHAGDSAAALKILETFTSDDTVYLPGRFLLAMIAWHMGQLDWSLQLLQQCHDADPMEGTVAEALASLYAQVGNLRESLYMGKLATALGGVGALAEFIAPGFPNFDAVFYNIKEQPLLRQSKASLAHDKLDEAIEKLRQHCALNPQDGDAHALLAELSLNSGKASMAVAALRPILESGAKYPATCASLYARALTAVGAFTEADHWHARAAELEPENAEIAGARIADNLWTSDDPGKMAAAATDWACHFCAPAKPRQWRRPDGKLVIGYIVSGCDHDDIDAIAAVARAHDRGRVTVIGYGTGPQGWTSNVAFQGAFDTWQDIRALDPATLARFFLRGGLHVAIDTVGFAAPGNLLSLARLDTAIRVSWLGNSAGLRAPIYDAHIVAGGSGRETDWSILGGYPVIQPHQGKTARAADAGVVFGSDVKMPQLDDDTVKLWSTLLRAQPDAKLLLRAHDMAAGENIDRLVTHFGRELAARIDIVDAKTSEAFYSSVDVALAPLRGVSARMTAQALACGVPPVAPAGEGAAQPYGAFLRACGLGPMLVAADDRDYVSIALALATSEEARAKAIAAMAEVSEFATDGARRFAAEIENHALEALERCGSPNER